MIGHPRRSHVIALILGAAFGYSLSALRNPPEIPVSSAQAELAEARSRIRTLTASAAVAQSALREARESQARVEIRTVTRIVRAQEREAAIVAEPPTEQGAAESMARAAEFERGLR